MYVMLHMLCASCYVMLFQQSTPPRDHQVPSRLWPHPRPNAEAPLRRPAPITPALSRLPPLASNHPLPPTHQASASSPPPSPTPRILPSHPPPRAPPPHLRGRGTPPLTRLLPAPRLPLQNQPSPAQPMPSPPAGTEGAWGRLPHPGLQRIWIRIPGREPRGVCLHSTRRRSRRDPMPWGRGCCGRCRRAALRGAWVTGRAGAQA